MNDVEDATFLVESVEHVTPTIAELWLSPLHERLSYEAGQYVLLEGPGGEPPQRSYSIANAPRPDGRLSLLVTRVADGATSTWVHTSVGAGDRVGISGPYGTFVADEDQLSPCLYIAAGSGLAPIRALLEQELSAPRERALTLLFSARTEADVIDGSRLRDLERRHSRLRFVRTLTRASGPPPTGRLPGQLGELAGSDLSAHLVYIAGAPEFVADCARAARRLGAPRDRVRTEVFFAEPQPWTSAPPAA